MEEDRGGIEITQGDFSEAFYAMVGRALSDTAYREQLLTRGDRRVAAARQAGLIWNDDLDRKLEEAIRALDNLADYFGNSSAAT